MRLAAGAADDGRGDTDSSRRRPRRSKDSSASFSGRSVSAKQAAMCASRSFRTGTTGLSASSRCGSSIRCSRRRNGVLRLRRSSGARVCSARAPRLVLTFAFDVVGVHRLEARAAVQNGRGNGALRKIGAVQEGILRKSFLRAWQSARPGTVGDHRRRLVSLESRVGREESTRANPVGDPRLVIVRRGHFATFELLSRTFADDPSVQIIWDRRMGERRQSPDGPGNGERRAATAAACLPCSGAS